MQLKNILCMLVAVLFLSISSNIFAQLTRQQAINKVLNEIVVADTGHINVWSALEIKYYQDTIGLIMDTILECPYNYNWVFFIDDHPGAGWAHPCRYIFIDSISGAYQIVDEKRYPLCFGYNGSSDYELVMQIPYIEPATLPPNQNPRNNENRVNEHLYAVIIISQDAERWTFGMPPEDPNRFWYDASLIFNTLIEHGYSKDNIFVHYWAGYSWRDVEDLDDPDDPSYDIDYEASRSRILETFDNLAGTSTSDNDVPALGPDDQLFVYIDGHGVNKNGHSTLWLKYPYRHYLYDSDIATSLEPINCAQILFLVQPCESGNFAVELTDFNTYDEVVCENRLVHTSTTLELQSTSEKYITGNTYTEFTYYWAAAVRGVYPVTEAPWTPSAYETGSFPFDDDDFDFPIPHPDDYNPDLNEDGFVQLEEAFLYADDMDIYSPNGYYYFDQYCPECYEEPVRVDKIGYDNEIRWNNLITLHGLAGSVLDDDVLLTERNYMAGNTITVEDDNSFLIEFNLNFYLTGDEGKINVVDGGELEIEEDVNFYSNELNINGILSAETGVNFHDQEINITGEFDIEPNVTFNNTVVNLLNPNMESIFNFSTFNSGYFTNYGAELNITNSDFNNCIYNYSYAGDINISQSDFYNCWLILENASSVLTSAIDIHNCTFLHDDYHTMAAIDIWNYNNLLIYDNEIDGYYNGIQLLGSGQYATMTSTISNNEIKNCTRNAVAVVGSNVNLSRNFLHDNYYGLATVNNSNIALVGDCNANSYEEINFITNNDVYEIYATNGSFPWNFRFNAIIDEDNLGNPDDPLILIDPVGGLIPKTHVEYNCWGNNFNPSEDLNPSAVFIYNPTWCPGDGCQKSTEIALQTMLDGKEYFENGDYTEAKETFEEVIDFYPKTQYAGAAMKELFALEKYADNDYNDLKQYYGINDSIQADSVLAKLADYLINKCEIELQNWQTAIDHFEDIIEHPESTADSIFAIIDLGYTYKLIGDSSARATVRGKMTEHIPTSAESFIKQRDYLLSLLPLTKFGQETDNVPERLKAGELLQNIPNPFLNETTIHYKLDEKCLVEIKVYDYLGKVVKTVSQTQNDEGVHTVGLDMSEMASGIYFYSLYLDGKHSDTKKMVMK